MCNPLVAVAVWRREDEGLPQAGPELGLGQLAGRAQPLLPAPPRRHVLARGLPLHARGLDTGRLPRRPLQVGCRNCRKILNYCFPESPRLGPAGRAGQPFMF